MHSGGPNQAIVDEQLVEREPGTSNSWGPVFVGEDNSTNYAAGWPAVGNEFREVCWKARVVRTLTIALGTLLNCKGAPEQTGASSSTAGELSPTTMVGSQPNSALDDPDEIRGSSSTGGLTTTGETTYEDTVQWDSVGLNSNLEYTNTNTEDVNMRNFGDPTVYFRPGFVWSGYIECEDGGMMRYELEDCDTSGECVADSDCSTSDICMCGGMFAAYTESTCIPAECALNTDCEDDGRCAVVPLNIDQENSSTENDGETELMLECGTNIGRFSHRGTGLLLRFFQRLAKGLERYLWELRRGAI